MEHGQTPPLTLAPEASPDEATMRAVESGSMRIPQGLDLEPTGRRTGSSVGLQGARFRLEFGSCSRSTGCSRSGCGSRSRIAARGSAQDCWSARKPLPERRAAAPPISTRSVSRRQNSTIDTDIGNSAGSMTSLPATRGFGCGRRSRRTALAEQGHSASNRQGPVCGSGSV